MPQQSPNQIDVLISGAGPTGLMLALLLARDGVRVRIVDENAHRVKESRALAIQPKSMELLQNIGLVDEFLKRGAPASGIAAYMDGKRILDVPFSGIGRDDTPFPYIFMLSQSITEEILETALNAAGTKVERLTTLESFEQGADVVAKLKHQDGTVEETRAKYLVGCDGAKSPVRKSMGLSFEGGTYEQEFMLADATVKWDLPKDRLQLFFGDRALAIFFPMANTEASRVIVIAKSAEDTGKVAKNLTTKGELTLEELESKFELAIGRKAKLENPLWLTRYRVHHRSVEKMQVGRVFLAGDAAHIHSPAGGQGMNTGLQDAANLAWKLTQVLKEQASPELLLTYDSERMPIARKLLHFTDRIFSVGASFNPFTKFVLGATLPTVMKFVADIAPKYMFGFVSQLNIHYHPSLAVKEAEGGLSDGTKIRPGCRAPDAKLADGTTLLEMLKGYRFNLLVISRKAMSEAERAAFETKWRASKRFGADAKIHWLAQASASAALDRYGVQESQVLLVRPDGYVGFQTDRL